MQDVKCGCGIPSDVEWFDAIWCDAEWWLKCSVGCVVWFGMWCGLECVLWDSNLYLNVAICMEW